MSLAGKMKKSTFDFSSILGKLKIVIITVFACIGVIVAACLLISLLITFPFIAQVFTGSGETIMYEWSEDLEFSSEHYVEIEKNPDRDFKILNLTDIQIYDDDLRVEGGIGEQTYALVARIIEDQKPDLITISGDSFVSTFSSLKLINLIESFGIPWAPAFGNHEGGCEGKWVFWAAWYMASAEHSLFELGPEDMGYGNYIVNITENGKTIHSIYFLDTHNQDVAVADLPPTGYEHLWDNQIEWYEWAVRGNEGLAGHPIQSTVIMHIPLNEYNKAWTSVSDKQASKNAPLGEINPNYASIASGRCIAGVTHIEDNGFFEKIKELGSTKDVIVGHEHWNDYSVLYEDVRLTYSLKTGFGESYLENMIGGTVYTINSDGQTCISHVYYELVCGEWMAK